MPRSLVAALLTLALLTAPVPGAATPAASAAGPCRSGYVSLTFDDGPSATVTPRLVRSLVRLHVPATFFMVGERVATAPAAARLVASSGFLVANHTYRHEDLTTRSRAQIRATLAATERRLRATGLRPTNLMRPPYGAIDDRVRRAIASTGLVPVLWDVDPRDWAGGSTATIASRILAGLHPHASNVVLQHDGVGNSPASIAAVPRVVQAARRRGYCFVALDERGRPGFPTPTARLSASGAAEGGAATAVVRLDKPTARPTSVRLDTRPLAALAGADYTARHVVVRLPAGSTRSRVRIPVLADSLDERVERFAVAISHPVGLRIGTARGVVAIADRDAPPGVSAVDRSVQEPTTDPVTVPVRLRLARPSGRRVLLRVRTVGGTAHAHDFTPFRVRVAVPAGTRTVSVPVTILPDTVDEPDETFVVRIRSAVNARIVHADATVTITPPPPPASENSRARADRRRDPSPRG